MLSGCVTIMPPAFNQDVEAINTSQESIAMLTVKVGNNYKPKYQPKIWRVNVWQNINGSDEQLHFNVEKEYKKMEDEYNEYLISFQLPPGQYELRNLLGRCGVFVAGSFIVPVHSTFDLEANKIIYLGHIDAFVEEKINDDDLRAGPVTPLIDQAVVGAGGTFVLEINDQYEEDIEKFKNQYPYLVGYDIENKTLPQWKKPSRLDM